MMNPFGSPMNVEAAGVQDAPVAAAADQPITVNERSKVQAQALDEAGRCAVEDAAAAAAGREDEEDDGMTSMEYIMAFRELPPFEVELIMRNPVQRTPFADTEAFRALIADPSTTQDDIDEASVEHEEHLDMRVRFHEWVRSEYEAKGYVAVSDEYIARRARMEEFSAKLWAEGVSDSDDEDDVEEEEEALRRRSKL